MVHLDDGVTGPAALHRRFSTMQRVSCPLRDESDALRQRRKGS